MKTQNTKNTKKRKYLIITSSLILAALLAGSVLAYVQMKNTPQTQNPSDTNKTNSEDSKNNDTPVDVPSGTDESPVDVKPTPVDSSKPTGSTGLVITASTQNGSTYQIRALINATTTNGTCTLTLAQGSRTVTKQVNVQAGPSSATCKGFDIPVSELSVGEWTATIIFNDNNNNTGTVSQKITVS